MNAVDTVQLRLFLAEITHARAGDKDHRAEEAIRRMLERQPDAAYLLVQRVMQLENALCVARASGVAPVLRAAAAGGPSADRNASPRFEAPWWMQSAAAFAGVAFLARSAEYLLGPWI